MLSRLLPKPSYFRCLKQNSTKFFAPSQPLIPLTSENPIVTFIFPKLFSSNHNNNDNNKGNKDHSESDFWKLSSTREAEFGGEVDSLEGLTGEDGGGGGGGDSGSGSGEWETAEGYKPWSLVEDQQREDLFDAGEEENVSLVESSSLEREKSLQEAKMLEREEQELTTILKGPNRAFGDLIAASGITDEMLDSLIALKDFEGVEGLPPLRDIEDWRYEKTTKKSTRAEIERQKQEEVAKARVRQVDDKGRAYGTGRRKCSIARVWIEPGDGKFIINDKQFDVYFPMLDQRAALLRPFSETKTLGLWDVKCTVKGGGISGQVGAVRLGISRALQNWEPDLRPPLRAAGFLTRDSRVVERKKPGKAKARKSFQWVKR